VVQLEVAALVVEEADEGQHRTVFVQVQLGGTYAVGDPYSMLL
jgi:hypothetical protein